MVRLLLAMVPLLALVGCPKENPDYCPHNPGMMDCPGDASNGGMCGSDSDCSKMTDFPACDTAINHGTCEPCTSSNRGVCKDTMPRCEKNACVACVDDAQDCQGGVCLTTGGCADTATIIHAASSSAKTTGCGDPGNPCSLPGALALVGPSKNIIKLDDAGPYVSDTGFVVDTVVTIDARSATLHRNGNGAIVTVNDGKGLTLLGGIIENAQGGGGDGIKCGNNSTLTVYDATIMANNESGIDGTSCAVSVTHSKILNNSKAGGAAVFPGIGISNGSITISRSQIISNRGGGITIANNATFTVIGNMFLNNGDSGGLVGGLGVMTTVPGNRLEFNTFAENISGPSVGAGIQCQAPSSASPNPATSSTPGRFVAITPLTAQDNVVWNNNGPTGLQVFGTCLHAFSDIGPTAIPTTPVNLDGGNNFNMNPAFVGPTTDLEVQATSPIRGKGNPGADVSGIASVDIKGNARTVRSGAGPDPGAYVVPAQ